MGTGANQCPQALVVVKRDPKSPSPLPVCEPCIGHIKRQPRTTPRAVRQQGSMELMVLYLFVARVRTGTRALISWGSQTYTRLVHAHAGSSR